MHDHDDLVREGLTCADSLALRGDQGVTLIELVAAIALSVILVAAAGNALIIGFRTTGDTTKRLGESLDAQLISNWFRVDVTSAAPDGVDPGAPAWPCQGSAPAGTTNTMQIRYSAGPADDTEFAVWRFQTSTSGNSLVRYKCVGGQPAQSFVVATHLTSVPSPKAMVMGSPPTVTLTVTEDSGATLTFVATGRTGVAGPVVSFINLAGPTPTDASTVQWKVTFSTTVTGVDASDFVLALNPAPDLAGPAITKVTGSGQNYTVTANTGTGTGTLGLKLVDDDSIKDASNIPLGGTGPGNGDFVGQSYEIDRTPPTIVSVAATDPNPTAAATVNWTVTFSESVTGVDVTDFVLVPTGVSNASISGVSGNGSSYTVTANTGVGSGSLGVNLVDNHTIQDLVGNQLGGGNPTGALYTITKPPAVVSIATSSPNPTNAAAVNWTVTFTAPVTGVDVTDFTLAASGVSGATVSGVSGSGAAYTVTATTGTGSGTLGLNLVDNDSIKDAANAPLGGPGAGNGNFTGASFTIDRTGPTVVITSETDANGNVKVFFTGTAEAGGTAVTVAVCKTNVFPCSAINAVASLTGAVAANGSWTSSTSGNISRGQQFFAQATQSDNLGNPGTSPVFPFTP